MSRRVGIAAVFLTILAWPGRSVGSRALVQLDQAPPGTQWIGWNENGRYTIALPPDWRYRTSTEYPTKVLLAGGREADLPAGVALEAIGSVRLRVRSGYVRGRQGRRLALEVSADRLYFSAGAQFLCSHESFGPTGQAEVLALVRRGAPPLELVYTEEFDATFERVQWQAGPQRNGERGARCLAAAMPGLAEKAVPERLTSLGLWSSEGLRLAWRRNGVLAVETDAPGWCELNGATVRPQAVLLEAPRAEIWVRRATFRRHAPIDVACRVKEPADLLAEGLRIVVGGAPELVSFAAADTPAGFRAAMESLAAGREAAGGRTEDAFTRAIDDYLLPLWYGLWYDAATAGEEVREPPALTAFAAAYAGAVQESRPRLRDWLERHAEQYSTASMNDVDRLAEVLDAVVGDLSAGEPRAAAWWSIYLSDLLSTIAEGPVFYWHDERLLSGAVPRPAVVDLERLAQWVSRDGATALQRHLQREIRAARRVDEVAFDRLGPYEQIPLAIVVDAGRTMPVGRYAAEIRLVCEGAPERSVPLVVHVRPSLGGIAVQTFAYLFPIALLFAFIRSRRPGGGEAAERRRMLRAVQQRYRDWRRFEAEYLALAAGEDGAAGALDTFAELGLHEVLSPDLFAEYLRVKAGEETDLPGFVERVRRHFTRLAEAQAKDG